MKSITWGLNYEVYVLLQQVRDGLIGVRNKALRKYKTSTKRVAVLFIIEALDGKGIPAEIARWLTRKPHSVSTILQRMEKQGLVKKSRDLEKRNQVRISMTEEGKQLYNQALDIGEINQVMSVLSEEELCQLRPILLKLRKKAFDELGIGEPPWYPVEPRDFGGSMFHS